MPFGPQEAFFIPEVTELLRQGHEILLVPRGSHRDLVHQDAKALPAITCVEPLFSVRVLSAAARVCLRWPGRVFAAVRLLGKSRSPWVLLKTLAVVPKALWLADLAVSRGVQHIHAHWALTTATMAMVASRVSRVPWSLTAHRGDIVGDNLLATKVQDAAFVRVISESGLRLAKSIAGKALMDKAAVIRMGVPIPEQVDLKPPGPWKATLLCPANLKPVKGHCHLLQAIALLKARRVACVLQIAGDGPLRAGLESQARALQITDRVSFLGQLPHDAILARYRGGQVGAVVLPSIDLGGGLHEGIPVALLEAMSYGVPVISTTTGGIPELLEGDAGALVPPANPAALADAIQRLIQDASWRARLGQAGRNRVIERHSIDQIVAILTGQWETSARPQSENGRRDWESTSRRQAA